MPFKFTMMFNVPSGGISETWYWNGGLSLPQGFLSSPMALTFQARCALLSAQAVPVGWRLTDVDNPRVTQLELMSKVTQDPKAADVPTTGWLAIAKGANNVARRQVWLRGAADDSVSWDVDARRFVRSPDFNGKAEQYFNILKAQDYQWSIKHILSRKEQAGAWYNVTAVNPSAAVNGVLLVSTNLINPLTPLIVGGFKKPLGKLNGTYLPQSGFRIEPTGVFLIGKTTSAVAAAGYPGGGTLRNQSALFVKVAQINLEFARSRKAGRSFFELRGSR